MAGGLAQPLKQLGGKTGGNIREQRSGARVFRQTQKIPRGFVQHVDMTDLIAHQDASLHALNDEVVDLPEVGQIHAAALGQIFRRTQALGQGVRQQCGGEHGATQQAGLGIALGHPHAACERRPIQFEQDRNRGEGGKKHG